MAAAGQLASSDTGPQSPASFLASAAALDTIGKALRAARHGARLSRPPRTPTWSKPWPPSCCCGRSASSSPNGKLLPLGPGARLHCNDILAPRQGTHSHQGQKVSQRPIIGHLEVSSHSLSARRMVSAFAPRQSRHQRVGRVAEAFDACGQLSSFSVAAPG